MKESSFARLEDVIRDALFPELDVDLRQGCHIDREEADRYAFLLDAQAHLETFYQRYGCELMHTSDGYFYLLPTGDRLGHRHLTAAEMLVGQVLALVYLDPTTVQARGLVGHEQLVARLVALVGERELIRSLNPRRKKYDERVAQETVRLEVGKALRGLCRLGFVEQLDGEQLRLRAPLLRFAEPVRGLEDRATALERLVSEGKVTTAPAVDEDEAEDEP